MGKNYQKLIGKHKKHKSIFIFGSIFIFSSQKHIQQNLQGILRTEEGKDEANEHFQQILNAIYSSLQPNRNNMYGRVMQEKYYFLLVYINKIILKGLGGGHVIKFQIDMRTVI